MAMTHINQCECDFSLQFCFTITVKYCSEPEEVRWPADPITMNVKVFPEENTNVILKYLFLISKLLLKYNS